MNLSVGNPWKGHSAGVRHNWSSKLRSSESSHACTSNQADTSNGRDCKNSLLEFAVCRLLAGFKISVRDVEIHVRHFQGGRSTDGLCRLRDTKHCIFRFNLSEPEDFVFLISGK
mmetsp:Transcript_43284/g.69697  ORF Transcript_43284/g.69697 Transcript_43284/m.69697 type:complete len:114 (-) Transcript_43284:17-358(-)